MRNVVLSNFREQHCEQCSGRRRVWKTQSVVPKREGAGFQIVKASEGCCSVVGHECSHQVHLGRISTLSVFVSFSSYFSVCDIFISLFQVLSIS